MNGSPHENGCTRAALDEASATFREEGVNPELFWIGNTPLSGCLGCGYCRLNGKCMYHDAVNIFADKAKTADGFIFASPVHYAAASGAITSFMDRVFFSCPGDVFRLKPGAVIVTARRGGTTAAFDQLCKYLSISQMPIITSQYWNMVHGMKPEDIRHDLEGLQTVRTLVRNMVWFIRCKNAGLSAGIPLPKQEEKVSTHFIR